MDLVQNQSHRRHERGVSTMEYAIMPALVGLAVALATNNIRDGILGIFEATLTIINVP